MKGSFTVFEDGESVCRSSLGDHAVLRDGSLFLARPVELGLGARLLDLPLLADYLPRVLGRPLIALPPIGCIRWDDVPGTGQHQLEGRAKDDAEMARRIDRIAAEYRARHARLVVAVASTALRGGGPVPLDEVWPRSIGALHAAVAAGIFEPACHGTLHLDTDSLSAGVVEAREFARLSAEEAGRRIDAAVAWLRGTVGEPTSFIAPAWGYSPGTLAAAAERHLPTWREPAAGPLLVRGLDLHETLGDSLRGINGLDYRFLRALAAVGLPPTIVFHGRLLDHRELRARHAALLARLFVRREIIRVPAVAGVRWVGAAELIATLRAHDETELGAPPASRFLVS